MIWTITDRTGTISDAGNLNECTERIVQLLDYEELTVMLHH